MEPGRTRSRSGGPPPHSPEVRGRRPRAGSPRVSTPNHPGLQLLSLSQRSCSLRLARRASFWDPERGDTRRTVTGDPGVLPAFPSPSRGSQGCSYLVPRRSRAEGVSGAPLRGTREARGAGFHRHPRSSRVLAPLRLRGLGAPDTRERSTAPESCPSGDGEPRSRLPGWV